MAVSNKVSKLSRVCTYIDTYVLFHFFPLNFYTLLHIAQYIRIFLLTKNTLSQHFTRHQREIDRATDEELGR